MRYKNGMEDQVNVTRKSIGCHDVIIDVTSIPYLIDDEYEYIL